MPKFNPPEPMSFDAPAKWPEWKERFARFRISTNSIRMRGKSKLPHLYMPWGGR